ncbi:TcaA NTF2-like domain-containing protein [Heyndrickxia ginsengihumi]|uniref:TcaA NTF2-like domain-containing protein n=1 Tax=Heyndrickxia ginsengihumi TaxID=363870 RepID=UPI001D691256|nr:hypothetical protein [Heyndrickxia ginsengihumi]MBE6182749.1 hypothetical protein [Bacillus sp. (in: firmicutes)]MCM3021938.1 hypothetical protein [Heyndrickxia ginsengihumi]
MYQKGRKGAIFALFALLSLGIVGCGDKAALTTAEPDVIHQSYLMFKETNTNDNDQNIGTLYLKTEGNKEEKISENVIDGSFSYNNDQDKAYFLNDENELYEYEAGKDKIKLAKDVAYYIANDASGIVSYQNDDGDLYVLQGKDDEEDKISSHVREYAIIDQSVYFIDDDGDFSMYNLKDHQETEIASDVTYFTDLNGKDEIAYLNDDSALYFKKIGDDQSIKITNEEVLPGSIQKIGDRLVYLNGEDEDSTDLYTAQIKEASTPVKIASDAGAYKYDNNYYYYVDTDGNLFRKKENEESATKLASDVKTFKIKKHTVFYLNDDDELFKLVNTKEPQKIASSVVKYNPVSKKEVVYKTDDDNLFINNKKIASDIDQYKYYFGNLAFATNDDKLYEMKDMDNKTIVDNDLHRFSTVSYQNNIIFKNELTFDDIAGIWGGKAASGNVYIEIDKNGMITDLQTGEQEKLKTNYAEYNKLAASAAGTDVGFELTNDHSLKFTTDLYNDGITLTKSSKAKANEYFKNMKAEADKEEITNVMDDYLKNFADAVNYGESHYITDYIDPESDFFKTQETFVDNCYEKNIKEELVDYHIANIKQIDQDSYSVTTQEDFKIYNGYDDEKGSEKKYTNTYTVKRVDDSFLITNLKVGNSTEGI